MALKPPAGCEAGPLLGGPAEDGLAGLDEQRPWCGCRDFVLLAGAQATGSSRPPPAGHLAGGCPPTPPRPPAACGFSAERCFEA